MSKVTPWIILGGREGELCYCRRCGHGLAIRPPCGLKTFSRALQGFQEDHEHCKEGDDPHPEVVTQGNWASSRDTGISSWTIYSVLRGMPSRFDSFAPPQDPDDFGRCYRLLQLFPEWRPRLIEVSTRFPQWTALVREWLRIERMYAGLKENDDRSKLYLAIRDALEESKNLKSDPADTDWNG